MKPPNKGLLWRRTKVSAIHLSLLFTCFWKYCLGIFKWRGYWSHFKSHLGSFCWNCSHCSLLKVVRWFWSLFKGALVVCQFLTYGEKLFTTERSSLFIMSTTERFTVFKKFNYSSRLSCSDLKLIIIFHIKLFMYFHIFPLKNWK